MIQRTPLFPSRNRRARAWSRSRGFTLLEIVIAMMLLSLGIMGCIALFFLGVHHSRESIRLTRSAIIAENVKNAMVDAMRFPRYVTRPGGETLKWFRFELPPSVDRVVTSEADLKTDDINNLNGFYFQVSDQASDLVSSDLILKNFKDYLQTPAGNDIDEFILDLPREAFDSTESLYTTAETWNFQDEPPLTEDAPDFDMDDSAFYSFRIILRRSVRFPSVGIPGPGDLLCCTVLVYRQYVPGLVTTFEDYDDYGQPSLPKDATGQVIEELRPIYKFQFYLSGA